MSTVYTYILQLFLHEITFYMYKLESHLLKIDWCQVETRSIILLEHFEKIYIFSLQCSYLLFKRHGPLCEQI